MFQVTVNTGPSQAFNVFVDRIPVAGDFISSGNNDYLVETTYMTDGGGTNVGAKIQNASSKGSSAPSGRAKTARSGSKKSGR